MLMRAHLYYWVTRAAHAQNEEMAERRMPRCRHARTISIAKPFYRVRHFDD